MDAILSVRQVTEQVRQAVEGRFPYVWVRGEVTNLARPLSGHVYFSLKEDDFLLHCVWFRGQQKEEAFDPLTGEVWENGPRRSLAHSMENGQTVICAGRLTVYGARGQYQMIVDIGQAEGLGLWYKEFEALKRKLAAEGLFDAAHKRPIPKEPRRVAVITAPTGAAIRDFIRISASRGLGAEIRVMPVPVQGEEAPSRIAEALDTAGKEAWAQVAVLIRGGGSVQDLWAFNDERVARAVYRCPIPVLTGIGHEIDHSITDFTADFSAATPSHTAQILWQERHAFAQQIDDLEGRLGQAFSRRADMLAMRLEHAYRALCLLSPKARLLRQEEKLQDAAQRMEAAAKASLEQKSGAVQNLALMLSSAGEACLQREERVMERASASLDTLRPAIGLAGEQALLHLETRLNALDPFEPLRRGYAMAYDDAGNLMRSAAQTAKGRSMSVILADGRILGTVTGVEPLPITHKNTKSSAP